MGLSYSRLDAHLDARCIGAMAQGISASRAKNSFADAVPNRLPAQERRFLQALALRGVGTEPDAPPVPTMRVAPETGWNLLLVF